MCFGIKKYVPLISFTIRIALVGLISHHHDVAYSASHQKNHNTSNFDTHSEMLTTSRMDLAEPKITETDLSPDKAAEKSPKKNIKKELLVFLDSARNRIVQALKTPIVRYGTLVTGAILTAGYAILSSSFDDTLANRETLPQTASPENCIEASEKETVNQSNRHPDEDCTPCILISKSMGNPRKRPTIDMPKLSLPSDITKSSTKEDISLEPLELIDSEGVNSTSPIIAVICTTLDAGTNALPSAPYEPTSNTTPEAFLDQQPQLTDEENQDIPDAATSTAAKESAKEVIEAIDEILAAIIVDIDTQKTIETGESQPPEDPIDNPPEDKIKTEKTPNPCEPRMFNTRDCFGLNGEYMHGF